MSGRILAEVLEAADAVPRFARSERFDEGAGAFVRELLEWGGKMHLTGREDPAGTTARQFADSLEMLVLAESLLLDSGGSRPAPKAADIGSGAGFPGVVWALARPGWKIILFERKRKLAAFLERTVSLLGLANTKVINEDLREGEFDEEFDIVTSKAAGRLRDILPLADSIMKDGGIYVTVKGKGWEGELKGAEAGFDILEKRAVAGGRGEAIAISRKRFT